MKYNSKYVGQYYQLQGGEVYVLRGDGRFAYAGTTTSGTVAVQLTGYYKTGADGSEMYQTVDGGWIRMADGWKNTGYSPIRNYTAKDAQSLVDKLIRNNARILENNLFCARYASMLTEDEQGELRELQTRLESRNSRLLNDGLCTDQKVSTPPGYANLQGYLQSFMDYQTISGVVVTIVVSAVVLASLSTAAYFAYKYLYAQSEQDVKYSDELTKTLMDKLTPEEYQQLMQETNGIVTKSNLKAKLGNTLGILKWGLVAAAGYVVYKSFKERKKQ